MLLSELHRPVDAKAAYRRVLELDPTHAAATADLGSMHRQLGEFEDALEAYDKAIALDASDVRFPALRAGLLFKMGRNDEAAAAYSALLDSAPNSTFVLDGYAWFLATCKDEEHRDPVRAVRLADRALAIESDDWEYWGTAGWARLHAGRPLEEVAEAFERSLALGGTASSHFGIAAAQARAGWAAEARAAIERGDAWLREHPQVVAKPELRAAALEALEPLERRDAPASLSPARLARAASLDPVARQLLARRPARGPSWPVRRPRGTGGRIPAMVSQDAPARLEALRAQIRAADHAYYVLDRPSLTDAQYDELYRELVALEAAWPELDDPGSPTKHVPGAIAEGFESFEHPTPMLSLNNVASARGVRRVGRLARSLPQGRERTRLQHRAQDRRRRASSSCTATGSWRRPPRGATVSAARTSRPTHERSGPSRPASTATPPRRCWSCGARPTSARRTSKRSTASWRRRVASRSRTLAICARARSASSTPRSRPARPIRYFAYALGAKDGVSHDGQTALLTWLRDLGLPTVPQPARDRSRGGRGGLRRAPRAARRPAVRARRHGGQGRRRRAPGAARHAQPLPALGRRVEVPAAARRDAAAPRRLERGPHGHDHAARGPGAGTARRRHRVERHAAQRRRARAAGAARGRPRRGGARRRRHPEGGAGRGRPALGNGAADRGAGCVSRVRHAGRARRGPRRDPLPELRVPRTDRAPPAALRQPTRHGHPRPRREADPAALGRGPGSGRGGSLPAGRGGAGGAGALGREERAEPRGADRAGAHTTPAPLPVRPRHPRGRASGARRSSPAPSRRSSGVLAADREHLLEIDEIGEALADAVLHWFAERTQSRACSRACRRPASPRRPREAGRAGALRGSDRRLHRQARGAEPRRGEGAGRGRGGPRGLLDLVANRPGGGRPRGGQQAEEGRGPRASRRSTRPSSSPRRSRGVTFDPVPSSSRGSAPR